MALKNNNFQNSLRCLQHPVTCLCIMSLLINDHILKVICPSWLTGKLSDFSGLFFFPFIVASGLSLLLSKIKITFHGISQIASASVGIWFVLLKTVPFANSITAYFASLLIGFPVHFRMDATDLIALLVMFPAKAIWKQPNSMRVMPFAYFVLIFGSLAAIATSPKEPTVYKVTSLEYYKDGIVYAADTDTWGEDYSPIAESLDGGETWQHFYEIRNIEKTDLPVKFCSKSNPIICYQVTETGRLQELISDGTWANIQDLEVKRVYDLILFNWEEKEFVIAAIGEYGVWRRVLPDGKWTKISILRANKQ